MRPIRFVLAAALATLTVPGAAHAATVTPATLNRQRRRDARRRPHAVQHPRHGSSVQRGCEGRELIAATMDSNERTLADAIEAALRAKRKRVARSQGVADIARQDASTRVHRGYQLCTNERTGRSD